MRHHIHASVLIFVLISGVLFSAVSHAEELRNCPAYIIIQDFEIADEVDEEESSAPTLESGANIAIQNEFRSTLSALLPKAKVMSISLDYGPDISKAKDDFKKHKEENERRAREGLPPLPWEGQTPPGDEGRLGQFSKGDFLVDGMLSKVGGRYYLAAKVITVVSHTIGFRTVAEFGSLLELPGATGKVAAQAAGALQDSFYGVEVEPKELKADKNEALLTAHVVNLKGEPVNEEPLKFESAKPILGEMRPEQVTLNGGIAKSRYFIKQHKPNSVKVAIKPRGPCGKGITNGLWVPVNARFVLQFEGDAEAQVEVSEEEIYLEQSYKTYFSDGHVLLKVDGRNNRVTGTGYCYQESELHGTMAGSVSGGQEGDSAKERIEVTVRGTVSDDIAELYIMFKPGEEPTHGHLWVASPESGYTETDLEVEEESVTATMRSSSGAMFGPFTSPLEPVGEQEIGPVKILLVDGEEVEFEFTPPSPIPEVSQHCRITFKIVSDPGHDI